MEAGYTAYFWVIPTSLHFLLASQLACRKRAGRAASVGEEAGQRSHISAVK